MFANVDAKTKCLLINVRCLAMQGKVDDALAILDTVEPAILTENSNSDRSARMMLKAEILYLEGHNEEALKVFQDYFDLVDNQFPHKDSLTVAYNRSEVTLALLRLDEASSFYRTVDERRISGIVFSDAQKVLDATEAALSGAHYEALPVFWQEVLQTYRQGCWQFSRAASKRFAEECLQLGYVSLAAYHAILSQDSKLANLVGSSLLKLGDQQPITDTVDMIMASCNPLRYATIACSLLETISDAISDSSLEKVIDWLLTKANFVPNNLSETLHFVKAWDAIASLAFRLNAGQSRRVLDTAISHSFWNELNTQREHLVKTVSRCVPQLSSENIQLLLEACLPLASVKKSDLDFPDVLNLLCRIAMTNPELTKERIGDALFPSGEALSSPLLLHIASLFGKQVVKIDEFNEYALTIASHIRLQVQRVDMRNSPKPSSEQIFDAPPENVMGTGVYFNKTIGEEKIFVSGVSNQSFDGLVKNVDSLKPETISTLAHAAIEMVIDSDNILSNKQILINFVGQLGAFLNDETLELAFSIFSPIALGIVVESGVTMTAAEARHPLNPFKINTGDPSDLRGTAIYALALLEKSKPGILIDRFNPILEQAITDPNEKVKFSAYAAANQLPTLSELVLTGLILGTRDIDPKAASNAYGVLANKRDLFLSEKLWPILVNTIATSQSSASAVVRRAAAITIKNLSGNCPGGIIAARLEKLKNVFASDFCYSVREPLLSSYK